MSSLLHNVRRETKSPKMPHPSQSTLPTVHNQLQGMGSPRSAREPKSNNANMKNALSSTFKPVRMKWNGTDDPNESWEFTTESTEGSNELVKRPTSLSPLCSRTVPRVSTAKR
ncbi:unnamed protein product [Dicrocoelium dendriticum]|nr:unnamed protein product [Dicrocoelium dendriticum]